MSMRAEVQQTFDWQNQWLRRVRAIVGYHLVQPASMEQDMNEATDLIVFEAPGGIRIPCRLRTPGYEDYHDFTVTCRRATGALCEWNKMVLGEWGDWFFYGHATHDDVRKGRICPWYIVNLQVARPWMRENHGKELGPNKDSIGYQCWFYRFYVRRLVREVGRDALIGHRLAEGVNPLW